MQERESPSYQIVRSRDDLKDLESQGDPAQIFIIEESLGYLVNYLARLFSQIHTAYLASHGVHLGQWGVLMYLWVKDGQTQRELSRQVAIDEASMVSSIDRMERNGLVRRVRNDHDRRQINIFLTEKGRALRDKLIPGALANNAISVNGLSEAEKNQLFTLLRRMIVSLEEALAHQQERTT
ncbi:MarR family transcriptional regulator [Ktedonosporobacter rubrisoli]|uniref:MarR family transcriptional regulator n=1 Tax=Ktedonosporobacter rubrisoli TaxID=2509675 RepID=A0A4P6JUK7_KTERU|nr:MarR family winged helix-turn-helix transcriptional regulator [Ktedonosporobacter rubrisoli]QBD78982.1 MarR family transcriptional regulator [Ktedonosporobacter rubrisoli]